MTSRNALAQSFAFSSHSSAWRSPAERQTHFVPGSSNESSTASAAVQKLLPACRENTPILNRAASSTQRRWYGSRSDLGDMLPDALGTAGLFFARFFISQKSP